MYKLNLKKKIKLEGSNWPYAAQTKKKTSKSDTNINLPGRQDTKSMGGVRVR